MLIRHLHKSDIEIGKESLNLSSDFTSNILPNRFSIQVPSFYPPSHNEQRFSNNNNPSSPSQTPPISSPQKTHHHQPQFTTPFISKFPSLKLKLLTHFRFLIFLSLPSLYLIVSSPTLLDFLFMYTFSAVVLISIRLALPCLPSIRLFFSRSLPTKLSSSNSSQPVVWSIGSKHEQLEGVNSGSWIEVYSNGDVYEGEFHKGKCSGSGVYHFHMSGRYEGDWVDGKYDGYGVETWARGSRYRGQYRQGLRHGIGIYRFFGGDVFAGEWSNGQCHGFGVHTCNDGSNYVGEFKWGVKHGLGQYHFR